MPNLRGVGRDAEDRAAEFLLAKGYTIITRRYGTRAGEIDIVALDGEILVFVEVKQRSAKGYVPEEAVGPRKVSRLCKAATQFMARTGDSRSVRFDLIALDAKGLRHHEGCFEPPDQSM